MKEILLYGSIYSFSAEMFITAIEEAKDADITVRLNSDGGSPEYGWGMIAKFQEHPQSKAVKVDGKAYSMGLYFLCYASKSQCLDVTEFVLHRAAYPKWIESSDNMTEAMWDNLKRINDNLKKAFAAKVDVKLFEQLTGTKLADVFDHTKRVDVPFGAKVAKRIGLVDEVVSITPKIRAEIEQYSHRIAAQYIPAAGETEVPITETEQPKNLNTNPIMTKEELKAKHPDVYAQILGEGVTQERDRVGAWMVYVDADPAAVKKGIEEGKALSQTSMAEFGRKLLSGQEIKKIEGDSAGETSTKETETQASAKKKEVENFEAEVAASMGLTEKK